MKKRRAEKSRAGKSSESSKTEGDKINTATTLTQNRKVSYIHTHTVLNTQPALSLIYYKASLITSVFSVSLI